MDKQTVHKLDIFEGCLSIGKTITFVLESPDKNQIYQIDHFEIMDFYERFIERTRIDFKEESREFIEAISEFIAYASIMEPHHA